MHGEAFGKQFNELKNKTFFERPLAL